MDRIAQSVQTAQVVLHTFFLRGSRRSIQVFSERSFRGQDGIYGEQQTVTDRYDGSFIPTSNP
jgi:hypothetical protein